ncbi:MAG: glycosyl hydrolase, partial [Propionibacterium sp.]|nr:glycosyl hydrolase [Propionibacterium sp.]
HLSDSDGVLTGQGGGDGGLFAGILARYLTLVANRFEGGDDTRQLAAHMVRSSADAAWRNAAKDADGLPSFGPEWNQPAQKPARRQWTTERDLSVQLSGWMLMEAAAALPA